jgi:hypothetical protein
MSIEKNEPPHVGCYEAGFARHSACFAWSKRVMVWAGGVPAAGPDVMHETDFSD